MIVRLIKSSKFSCFAPLLAVCFCQVVGLQPTLCFLLAALLLTFTQYHVTVGLLDFASCSCVPCSVPWLVPYLNLALRLVLCLVLHLLVALLCTLLYTLLCTFLCAFLCTLPNALCCCHIYLGKLHFRTASLLLA